MQYFQGKSVYKDCYGTGCGSEENDYQVKEPGLKIRKQK